MEIYTHYQSVGLQNYFRKTAKSDENHYIISNQKPAVRHPEMLLEEPRRQSPYCSLLTPDKKRLTEKLLQNDDNQQEDTTEEAPRPAGRNSSDRSSVFPVIINSSTKALGLIKGDIDIGGVQGNTLVEKRSTRENSSEIPDYTIESNRLDSYRGVWSENFPVSPRDLATAGLYFTGPNDRVQCAFCRGGLYLWQEGDSPLAEHRKHFSGCTFIQNNFDRIMQRYLGTDVPTSSTSTSGTVSNTPTEGSARPATKCKQIVHSLGYSMDDIDSTVTYLQQKGINPTVSNLIDALFENNTWSTSESQPGERIEPDEAPIATVDSRPSPLLTSHNSKPHIQPDTQMLREENRALTDRVTCKVCLSDDVIDVFLPCRHLVCCEACSKVVNKCPVCRTKISATIKAFLA